MRMRVEKPIPHGSAADYTGYVKDPEELDEPCHHTKLE